MAVTCPKCHFDNPEDTTYCGKCGTKFGHAAEPSLTRTLETTPEGLGKGELFAGRFELIEELGAGGMGIVYRAYDKKVGEEIALKILHPEIASTRRPSTVSGMRSSWPAGSLTRMSVGCTSSTKMAKHCSSRWSMCPDRT
jgi:hypothetical protein